MWVKWKGVQFTSKLLIKLEKSNHIYILFMQHDPPPSRDWQESNVNNMASKDPLTLRHNRTGELGSEIAKGQSKIYEVWLPSSPCKKKNCNFCRWRREEPKEGVWYGKWVISVHIPFGRQGNYTRVPHPLKLLGIKPTTSSSYFVNLAKAQMATSREK